MVYLAMIRQSILTTYECVESLWDLPLTGDTRKTATDDVLHQPRCHVNFARAPTRHGRSIVVVMPHVITRAVQVIAVETTVMTISAP